MKRIVFGFLVVALVGIVGTGVYLGMTEYHKRRAREEALRADDGEDTPRARATGPRPFGEDLPALVDAGGPEASAPPADAAAGSELIARFESETRDPAWAARAEEEIQNALAGFPRSMLQSVDCRARVCRLRIVHGDVSAYEAWKESFPQSIKAAEGATSKVDREDGSIQSESFLLSPERRR